MAYTPPANDAVDFVLVAYTAPANDGIDFEVNPNAGITGTVAEAQTKPTEAIGGTLTFAASVAEAQDAQTESIDGSLGYSASVDEQQPKPAEAVDGDVTALPVNGTVDETQPAQEEASRCVIADTAVLVDFDGGYGWAPFDPYGEVAASRTQKVGASVNEKTGKPKESARGTVSVAASVSESVSVGSIMAGKIGRSRAMRELDIEAILNAVA